MSTQVRGDNVEFAQLNEKVSIFDLLFRAKNPGLSSEKVLMNLHVDFEPQKTYHPEYPMEKRGIYYLARQLSVQLSIIRTRWHPDAGPLHLKFKNPDISMEGIGNQLMSGFFCA